MGGEADQVRWRGIRPVEGIRGVWPARNSVRIAEEAAQVGAGATIIYTVPTGKIFFLTSGGMAAFNSAGGGNTAGVGVRDGDDSHQYSVCFHYFSAQNEVSDSHQFFPALEVPADYDVYAYSNNASVTLLGQAFGWLEDA